MQLNFQKVKEKTKQFCELDAESVLSIVNDGILVMYALFVAENFLEVTMFRIHWPEHFHQILTTCTLMFLVVKLLYTRTCKVGEAIVMATFTGIFLMARVVSGYALLGDVLLFILVLKDIPFQKIVKVYFATISFLLVVTIVASQNGMIENLVYHMADRRERQAFGVCYPTDFAAFFVWLGFSWIYVRKEKLKVLEIGLLFLAGIGVWYFCDARLSAGILIISALMLAGIKLRQIYIECKGEGRTKVIPNWMQSIMIFATPICVGIILFLSYFYSEQQVLMMKLNSMLSGRLSLGHLAFEQYNVKLFGQFIPMVGFGKSSLIYLKGAEYFFIDSSFLSILMCYGMFVFSCIIFIFTISSLRAKKQNDYYLVLLIALIAVDCMVEHHMMEIGFNPFLFLLLSGFNNMDVDKRREKITGGETTC